MADSTDEKSYAHLYLSSCWKNRIFKKRETQFQRKTISNWVHPFEIPCTLSCCLSASIMFSAHNQLDLQLEGIKPAALRQMEPYCSATGEDHYNQGRYSDKLCWEAFSAIALWPEAKHLWKHTLNPIFWVKRLELLKNS